MMLRMSVVFLCSREAIMKQHFLLPAVLAVLLSIGQVASARDHFLTIGGGYSPTGNQISLEKNVQLFQRMLGERYPGEVPHDIYFSDGSNPGRDLQYQDPSVEIPRAQLLLARVFQQTRYQELQYRSHELTGVSGGAKKSNLEKWFKDVGAKLTARDRLFIYVTAHGGRASDKKTPQNTGLFLWNTERCQMREFAAFLEKIPNDVPVVTVMVQCYSGGFANIVFKEGDAKKGFTAAPRCGFFATVHNRVAAGCTPDINEEDYHEYSSYFWAALRGQTRTGKPIDPPDYDDDGTVSLAEAHAYVILTSPTIDIPIKTSDAFLRKYSRLQAKPAATKPAPAKSPGKKDQEKPKAPAESNDGKQPPKADSTPTAKNCPADSLTQDENSKEKQNEKEKAESKNENTSEEKEKPAAEKKADAKLLSADSDYAVLLEYASPADLAVLDGLSATLKLSGGQRAKAARDLAKQILDDKKKLDAQSRKLSGELKSLAGAISKSVRNRWPEFANRWHPRINGFLEDDDGEIVKHIESHGSYRRFEKVRQEIKKVSEKRFDLDRRWVKCQRLIRSLENVALAANLSEVASPEVQERYRQLVAAESGTFGQAPAVPVTAASSDGEPE